MDSILVLEKLINLERAIGKVDDATLRGMVMELEACQLLLQCEIVKDLHPDAGRRIH